MVDIGVDYGFVFNKEGTESEMNGSIWNKKKASLKNQFW